MDMTQKDYDARVQRREQGIATDEDLRLIKHYEREGFETKQQDGGDDGVGKPSVSEIRENAGDTGTDVVGGVPVGRTDGKADSTPAPSGADNVSDGEADKGRAHTGRNAGRSSRS